MEQAQLAIVVGFVVSLALQLAKRWWPKLDATDALTKQITAVVLAAVAVLAAAHWQLDKQTLWQAVVAAVSALGTHKALLAQDPFREWEAANEEAQTDD